MEIAVSGVGRDTQRQERIGAMQRGGAVLLLISLASPGGATWASAGQIPLQQLLPCAVGLLAAGVSLSQWFSKCGPWTSILSITRKPQNLDCQPHPRPVESEPWAGVSDMCVNKLLQDVRSG